MIFASDPGDTRQTQGKAACTLTHQAISLCEGHTNTRGKAYSNIKIDSAIVTQLSDDEKCGATTVWTRGVAP